MPAETNLTKAGDMKKIREVDFVSRFTHSSLAKLIEVLGVTRKIPMMEGTTMYVYSMSGTLENGAVAEGEVIPLTKIEQEKTAVGEITLKKWRKGVSAEAIKKSGYETAVIETDAKLLSLVQTGVRTDLFNELTNYDIRPAACADGEYVPADPFPEFLVDDASLWAGVRSTFCK